MAQDYPNLEHIVVDGASTDNTLNMLRRYERDYQLRWSSAPDSGQSEALNRGFRQARGDIVGWVNSDDTYMPGAMLAAVECLLANPAAGWVYGDGYWIDEDSRVIGIWRSRPFDLADLICKAYYIVQPTVFFRREILEAVGEVDEDLHYTMDKDFFFRMGIISPGVYIPRVLATRRLHILAKTEARRIKFIKDQMVTLDKVFANADLPDEIAKARPHVYANNLYRAGFLLFAEGEVQEARRHLWEALTLDPNHFRIQTMKGLVTLLQCYLGLRWYVPGKRARSKRYQLADKNINVKWRPS
jgi:glycosyltransferase involved in cell wall biosynthesis